MQSKPENNLKEYNEFLDCPHPNQKESTSNNSNTKTNKKDKKEGGELELNQNKKTNSHIFFYNPDEKTENENENAYENNIEDGYFKMPQDDYDYCIHQDGNDDEKFTEFYEVCDNTQKNPENDL